MKKIIVAPFLVVVLSLSLAPRAFADAKEDAQREFEAEVESMDMSDMKGQANTAETEAAQEEEKLQNDQRTLQELQQEKAHVEKTAKSRISKAEARRQKALKKQDSYTAQIEKLERQIAAMKGTVVNREARAQEAEDAASAQEAELDTLKQERSDLVMKKRHAVTKQARKKKNDDLDVNASNDMEVEAW